MYDPEMRKDCPMRGNLGNCSPVGGFCMDAVSDEICEAVHNAYNHGFCDALKTLKEQEAVVRCKDCKYVLSTSHVRQCCRDMSHWQKVDDDWFCAGGKRKE